MSRSRLCVHGYRPRFARQDAPPPRRLCRESAPVEFGNGARVLPVCFLICTTAAARPQKDRWVWEKTPYPVDGGTPAFRNIRINGVTVVGGHGVGGFLLRSGRKPYRWPEPDGLPYRDGPRCGPEKPAMMGNLEPMSARGFFLRNAQKRGISQRDAQKMRTAKPTTPTRASTARFLTGEKNETVR